MSRNGERGVRALDPPGAGGIVGDSPAMRGVRERIARVAPTGSTVLITGDPGVGKELVARTIHGGSRRAGLPFVGLSGASLEAILDPDPFGRETSAFGAGARGRSGLGPVSEPGTLFLTDVGEASPAQQLALLRFLKEQRFRRTAGAGGDETAAPPRVVAATTRNLARMVAEGDFRRDLFHCISVFGIHLPPLCARRQDVLPLARHFVARFARETRRDLRGLSPAAERVLEAHAWPGNVSELESVVERAVVLEGSNRVEAASLEMIAAPAPDRPSEAPAAGGSAAVDHPHDSPADRLPDSGFVLERHVRNLEREYLARALRQAGGVKVRAAGLLGMSFRSFRYYARKYDLG